MAALAEDHRTAELSAADRAMLDYALKLTREPWAMKKADVEHLREAGFDDAAILDIAQVTAYYAFVNRLADGLGVELESYWNQGAARRGEPDEAADPRTPPDETP